MHQPGAGGCGRWVPVPQADKVAPSLNCSVPFAVFSASVCEPRERGIKNHGLEAGTSDHIELCFMLIALEFTQNRLTPTRSDVVLQKSLQSVKKEVKPSDGRRRKKSCGCYIVVRRFLRGWLSGCKKSNVLLCHERNVVVLI